MIRIPPRLRNQYERFFERDLSAVQIFADGFADKLTRRFGVYALTIGDQIYFRKSVFDPEDQLCLFILCHEITHVLQKLRGPGTCGEVGTARELEREANEHALAFVQNRSPLPRISVDDFFSVRAFGPVGHYYSVYYLALAAGIEERLASKLALYAQMPDEISELDAMGVYSWIGDWFSHYDADLSRDELTDWLRTYGNDDVLDYMAYPFDFLNVNHRGLHCLTGGNSAIEEAFRSTRLQSANINEPHSFGLALHAFGDCFAHRVIGDETRMYGSRLGHAAALFQLNQYSRADICWSDLFQLKAMKAKLYDFTVFVDNVHKVKDRYTNYAQALYDILVRKSPSKPRRTLNQVNNALREICRPSGEDEQTKLVMDEIRQLTPHPDYYTPLEKTIDWNRDAKYGGYPKPLLSNLLNHAGSWARYTPAYVNLADRAGQKFSPGIPRRIRQALMALELNVMNAVRSGRF